MTARMSPSPYADVRARAQERARLDPSLIPHGTPQGYSYWGCRCWDCREVASQRRARQRAARGGAS